MLRNFKTYSLKSFQTYVTMLLTLDTMLYIVSPGPFILKLKVCTFWPPFYSQVVFIWYDYHMVLVFFWLISPGIILSRSVLSQMASSPSFLRLNMASIRHMSRQGSRGSAGDYQADEQAGVARLSWRVSGRWAGRCRAAHLASIRQMSRQVLHGSAGDYQADEQAGVA